LVREGQRVRIYDNLDSQVHEIGRKPSYLNKDAEFVKGDIRDREDLKKAVKGVEVIFHEAACVGIGQSQYEIKKYTDVNIGGTANLFDILAKERHRVKKVLIAASMSSYGEGAYRCKHCGVKLGKRNERDLDKMRWEPFCPCCHRKLISMSTPEDKERDAPSIYALTKKVQEDMAVIFSRAYKFPVISLRYFNVYGPRQSLSNPYTGVCAIFIARLKNRRPPVIYEDGKQSRDFVSVHDIVRANILAMESKDNNFKVYNVGSGNRKTIQEVATSLAKHLGSRIVPSITNRYRCGDIRHCYADIASIQRELGFRPHVNFETGMKGLLDWARGVRATDKFSQVQRELRMKGLL
jgi:dTDP-L-rhamnose 4-epimerase